MDGYIEPPDISGKVKDVSGKLKEVSGEPPDAPFPQKQVSKHYHYDNQKKILARFQFKPFTSKEHAELKRYAKKPAKRHIYPRFIFDELISFCHQCNHIRPAYSTMQSICPFAIMTPDTP